VERQESEARPSRREEQVVARSPLEAARAAVEREPKEAQLVRVAVVAMVAMAAMAAMADRPAAREEFPPKAAVG
jgi:hypothetical protein